MHLLLRHIRSFTKLGESLLVSGLQFGSLDRVRICLRQQLGRAILGRLYCLLAFGDVSIVPSLVDGSVQASDGRDAQRIEIQQKLATLTPHERKVLEALVDGRPYKSIAHELGLNVHIVEVHRANVMAKMQATSLSHLVRMTLLAPPNGLSTA